MAIALHGIGVFKGFAIGAAHVLRREHIEVPHYILLPDQVAHEVGRYQAAVTAAMQHLRAVRDLIPPHTPPDIAAFIDTHLLMLNDPMLTEAPVKFIKTQHCNAEWALKQQRDALVDVFEEMDDPYLRTRKDDVDHVAQRIQRALLQPAAAGRATVTDQLRGRIIIADDLSPADTLFFQGHNIAGLVVERGGPTSHTAILARNLSIPALVGVAHARRALCENEIVIIDGERGTLLAGCDEPVIEFFTRQQRELKRQRTALGRLRTQPAVTLDRQSVALYGNIELPHDITAVKKAGAIGVGLYRTEFMFMDRDTPPDEDEQFEAYVRVVKAFKDAPVMIRTLDVGGDKPVQREASGALATNPALGLRGIRNSLREPMQFKVQLRAILRASAYGEAQLMFPMLSGLQELVQVTQLLEEAKGELAARSIRFNANIPLGCVVETPAAAILAPRLARCVNFLSIGTNDLTQYTLAVDRGDSAVAHLYDALHPAVLLLLRNIIRAGVAAKIPVTLCGEMAGDIRYTRLLLGLGLREFSMNASTLLEVKRVIHTSDTRKLCARVKRILASHTPQEAAALLEKLNA